MHWLDGGNGGVVCNVHKAHIHCTPSNTKRRNQHDTKANTTKEQLLCPAYLEFVLVSLFLEQLANGGARLLGVGMIAHERRVIHH